MSSEIEFRVWCNNTSEWEKDEILLLMDGRIMCNSAFRGYYEVRKDTHILEQYTGLKDKNGVKIFEGDVIQEETERYYSVFWNKGENRWSMSKYCGIHGGSGIFSDEVWCLCNGRFEYEIIGNIHENPELLK
jgi:uncharacterized phage protein (TIGR01671 family)